MCGENLNLIVALRPTKAAAITYQVYVELAAIYMCKHTESNYSCIELESVVWLPLSVTLPASDTECWQFADGAGFAVAQVRLGADNVH